jgi:ubiquinone/menaquinone biosynthesis C-methylase UbiE
MQNAVTEGWQVEGDSADAYERYLAAAFRPWAARLVDLAEVHAGDRVLDLACGTGVVARRAAERVGPSGRVVGLDINDDMLRVARAAPAGRPIEWRLGNVANLPFDDGSFTVVSCELAMQFFSDPAAAAAEMRRVLDSRGRVAASVCRSLRHAPTYAAFAEVLERHAGPGAGAIMRSPFAPWDLDQFRAWFTSAGFAHVRVLTEVCSLRYPSCEEFVRREASSSPLAESVRSLSPESRHALVSDLREAIVDHLDDDGVVCPIELYVAIAR